MRSIRLDMRKIRERHTNFKSSWYETHETMDRSMTSLKADPDSARRLPTLARALDPLPAAAKVLNARLPSVMDRVGVPRHLNQQNVGRLGDVMLAHYIHTLVRK